MEPVEWIVGFAAIVYIFKNVGPKITRKKTPRKSN